VVRSGKTPVKVVHQVIEQLGHHDKTLFGIILIGSPDLSRKLNYYADYYYGSGQPDAPPEPSGPVFGAAPTPAANGNGTGTAHYPAPETTS
jgi:hypothetical protein